MNQFCHFGDDDGQPYNATHGRYLGRLSGSGEMKAMMRCIEGKEGGGLMWTTRAMEAVGVMGQ